MVETKWRIGLPGACEHWLSPDGPFEACRLMRSHARGYPSWPGAQPLQSKAGYIDAGPTSARSSKTSCDARPDHTSGENAAFRLSRENCDIEALRVIPRSRPPLAPHRRLHRHDRFCLACRSARAHAGIMGTVTPRKQREAITNAGRTDDARYDQVRVAR